MAPDPLRARARGTGLQLAFHTIGVKGYYNSVQPPLSEIPGSAPEQKFFSKTLNSLTPISYLNIHYTSMAWGEVYSKNLVSRPL